MDFLGSIKSINWVNVATYFSIILTLVIFFYQELSSRIEGKKEVKRIVEEIVDLVIRNHTSKQIGLKEVDLEFIVAGFENLKQFKLTINMSSFLKMIYAKVYTNEHITTDIRKEILRDLDDAISDMESNEYVMEIENKAQIDWRKKNELLSSIISILLLTFSYKYILVFEYLKNDKLLTFVLIFCIFIFVIYWLKPNLSIFLKSITKKQYVQQLEILRMSNFEPKDNREINFQKTEKEDTEEVEGILDSLKDFKTGERIKKDEEESDILPPLKVIQSQSTKKPKDEISEEIAEDYILEYLSRKFTEADIVQIKKILEQKFVFEILIRELYLKVYGTPTKLSYTKILNRLYNDGILDSERFNTARSVLRSTSYVIHEGKLSLPSESYKDLKHLYLSFKLLLLKLMLLEEELTTEEINEIRIKNKDNI